MTIRGLLLLAAVLAAPCVIVVACVRSVGWKRIGQLFLVMAATAFMTWLVCDFRLRNWKSRQRVQNRMNVCMVHDNMTALLAIGDEKLAREYVGFFGANGCTLLDCDLTRTAQGKELQERNLDWYVRIQELKEKRKDAKDSDK